jgi:hypothetical protein
VDRKTFLQMTAAMAAGACTAAQLPPDTPETVVVVAPAPTASASASATQLAVAEPEEVAEAAPAADDDDPSGEGYPDPSYYSPPVQVSSTPQSASCNNAVGAPGDCSTLRAGAGPSCESFAETKRTCGKFKKGLRPRTAAKTVACLLAKSGSRSICSFDVATQCVLESLRSVCIDPATAASCKSVVATCSSMGRSSINQASCQAALSAVQDRNRKEMVSCMTEGCAVNHCFYDLK